MRTTVDIDKRLIDEVIELTGEKSVSKAVGKVIEEYVRRKRTAELIAMAGKIDIVDNLEELEELELKEMEQAQW